MNRSGFFLRLLLLTLACLMLLPLLASCGGDSEWNELDEDSATDVLCRSFVDHVLRDEKDEVYALVGHMVDEIAFSSLWNDLRMIAEGATSAEIHQTAWQFFTDNGTKYFQSSYMVEYDTGTSMTLRLTSGERQGLIEGLGFTDTTGFMDNATASAERWDFILTVFSLLVLAFTTWMLVDCVRRPLKKKGLWILLILCGLSLTFTVTPDNGEFRFFVGLLLQFSTSSLDMTLPALITRVVLPVGPVIYFCLRKKKTVAPPSDEANATDPMTSAPFDTADVPPNDDTYTL